MKSDFSDKFSYWILVWFVLFIIGFIPYNPLIAFILAIITNFYALFVLFFSGYFYKGMLYLLVMLCIKVVPIYLLIYYGYTSVQKADIEFLIMIGFIYTVFVEFVKGKSLKNIYNVTSDDKINTPLMIIMDRIINYCANIKF